MTIAGTTVQNSGATGNGVTTQFSFTFNLDPNGYGATTAASQIQVIKETIASGLETPLVLTTDYTVSVNADQSASPGGSITMVTAPSSAYKIWIRLNPDFKQQTDYQNQGGFLMETVEDQADQQGRQILWLRDRVLKSPRVGVQAGSSFDGEVSGDLTPGAWPALKSDLTGYEWVTNSGSATAVTATGSLTSRTLANRFAELEVNVKDFGALGDGRMYLNGAISASSTTLTVSSATFTSADIGKVAWVQYAAGGGAPLKTTVASVTNSTTIVLANAANSGIGSVTTATVKIGTDDTTAIKAAIAALPASGGILYFPRGIYLWSDSAGMVIGDGTASSISTIQNVRMMGDVGGMGGDIVTNPSNGSCISYIGSTTGTYMLDVHGPIHFSMEWLAWEATYWVGTKIWNLKHVIGGFFHQCQVIHPKSGGTAVFQGAYTSMTGLFTGSSACVYNQCSFTTSGALGCIALDLGEGAYVAGFDVATSRISHCTFLVSDDTNAGSWPTRTATTSSCIRLRFCDNLQIEDSFTYVSGQRRGNGILVMPPSGSSPAGAYPSQIHVKGCSLIGGFWMDATDNTWRPDLVSGRGLYFSGCHFGDATDPGYTGATGLPSSITYGGISGTDDAGVQINRFQTPYSKGAKGSEVIAYSVTALQRKNAFTAVTNDTTPTNLASWTIPAYTMRTFDYTINADVFKYDRRLRLTAYGSYQNNTAGAANFTIKCILGSTTLFNSGAISLANSASFRTWDFEVFLMASNASNSAFTNGRLLIGAPGSGGTTAVLSTIAPYTQSQSGIAEDMTTDLTLRIEITHGTADANISGSLNHAVVELL